MNQKVVIAIVSCLLLSGLHGPVYGENSVAGANHFEQGRQAFRDHDYNTAVRYLQMAFVADPGKLDISFYLGLAALEIRDFETAIMSFERILISQPGAMRVKLELARSYMRLGVFESAKQYFYEVLASNPPQAVRENIDNFLSAIARAERRHFFSGTVSAGISYDDNSRSAPGDFLFTFPSAAGNITWPVSASPQSDYFTTATIVLNHIYRKEGSAVSWKTTATTINNIYDQYHDLDVNLYGISSGPMYETSRALFEVHGMFYELQVEHEAYMRPKGVGASAILSLGPKLIASVTTALQGKSYMEDSNSVKDATNFSLGFSPILMLGDNRITASFDQEIERAEADYWSYDRLGWGLRYDRALPWDFTAFAGYNRQRTKYDATKPGEISQRIDTVSDLYCGITKLLWQAKGKSQNITGHLSHSYTESESNIGVYDYQKNVSVAMVTYGF